MDMKRNHFGRLFDPDKISSIPPFLSHLYTLILEKGRNSKGIFREDVEKEEVEKVVEMIDSDDDEKEIDFGHIEVNILAITLKHFFAKLGEPLFRFDNYDKLVSISQSNAEEESKKLEFQEIIATTLPPAVYVMSKDLFEFLNKFKEFNETTDMDDSDLSIALSTNIVRPRDVMLMFSMDLYFISEMIAWLVQDPLYFFNLSEEDLNVAEEIIVEEDNVVEVVMEEMMVEEDVEEVEGEKVEVEKVGEDLEEENDVEEENVEEKVREEKGEVDVEEEKKGEEVEVVEEEMVAVEEEKKVDVVVKKEVVEEIVEEKVKVEEGKGEEEKGEEVIVEEEKVVEEIIEDKVLEVEEKVEEEKVEVTSEEKKEDKKVEDIVEKKVEEPEIVEIEKKDVVEKEKIEKVEEKVENVVEESKEKVEKVKTQELKTEPEPEKKDDEKGEIKIAVEPVPTKIEEDKKVDTPIPEKKVVEPQKEEKKIEPQKEEKKVVEPQKEEKKIVPQKVEKKVEPSTEKKQIEKKKEPLKKRVVKKTVKGNVKKAAVKRNVKKTAVKRNVKKTAVKRNVKKKNVNNIRNRFEKMAEKKKVQQIKRNVSKKKTVVKKSSVQSRRNRYLKPQRKKIYRRPTLKQKKTPQRRSNRGGLNFGDNVKPEWDAIVKGKSTSWLCLHYKSKNDLVLKSKGDKYDDLIELLGKTKDILFSACKCNGVSSEGEIIRERYFIIIWVPVVGVSPLKKARLFQHRKPICNMFAGHHFVVEAGRIEQAKKKEIFLKLEKLCGTNKHNTWKLE